MSKFQSIEILSSDQRETSNALLIYSLRQVVKSSSGDEKKVRKKQLDQFEQKLAFCGSADRTINDFVNEWWQGEEEWLKNLKAEKNSCLTQQLVYRVLVLFLRNHILCPFTKEKCPLFGSKKTVPDTDDYEEIHSEIFKEFVASSIENLSQTENLVLKRTLGSFKKLSDVCIDEEHYSALYKLMNKDKALLSGVAIGGVAGVTFSLIAGPIVGGWIGNAVGLYGAAATSYGLAFLGGGSLASGGFGMLGGSIVLGVGAGLSQGYNQSSKNVPVDVLNLAATAKNLPLLLATGKIMSDLNQKAVPNWIRKQIRTAKSDYEYRIEELEESDDEKAEETLEVLNKSFDLLCKAEDMAEEFDWISGYDLYKKVTSW